MQKVQLIKNNDKTAIIDSNGSQYWYQNYELYCPSIKLRDDNPAVIRENGTSK